MDNDGRTHVTVRGGIMIEVVAHQGVESHAVDAQAQPSVAETSTFPVPAGLPAGRYVSPSARLRRLTIAEKGDSHG
jgi:hypothetical protein